MWQRHRPVFSDSASSMRRIRLKLSTAEGRMITGHLADKPTDSVTPRAARPRSARSKRSCCPIPDSGCDQFDHLCILNAVRYLYVHVRNAGRGQLSSARSPRSHYDVILIVTSFARRHNENNVIMKTGVASAVGARRANDVIMRMTS